MQNIKELLEKLSNEELEGTERVKILSEVCSYYIEKGDLGEALKYAALSTVCTSSPTAIACCLMGNVYHLLENFVWAKIWYEKAINNAYLSTEDDADYHTWIPLMNLSLIATDSGNSEEAEKYLSAAMILRGKK